MSVAEVLKMLQSLDPHAIFPPLTTSYSKYSTSNYVAPALELEILTIREIISHHREQLKALNDITEELQRTLHIFHEKQELVESSLKMHEGFVSCIRRIPSDILREIFIHCLPSEEYIAPDKKAAPLLLTWICRSWREVALDTPRLWCSLSVRETHESPKEQTGFYQEHWLKNARLYPLSLKVNLATEIHGESWMTTATDFVRSYTSWCKRLSIDFEEANGLDRLLEDVPILEHLSLGGEMNDITTEYKNPGQTLSIIQFPPRLRTLIIDAYPFGTDVLSKFNPGWTNLTHLAVNHQCRHTDADARIFFMLLQMCRNLEQCFYSPVRFREAGETVSLTHPTLRVLGIAGLHGVGFRLNTLALPQLRHLYVMEKFRDVHTVLEDISIHARSSVVVPGQRTCDLTVDGMNYAGYSLFIVVNPGWVDITHLRLNVKHTEIFVSGPLEFCPRLEDIVVSSIDINNPSQYGSITHPILRSLTIAINSGSTGALLDVLTLPGLRHLNLTLPECSNWPHTAFKAFFSRSQCPLETIRIQGAKISAEDREEFASLIPTLERLDLQDAPESCSEMSESADSS